MGQLVYKLVQDMTQMLRVAFRFLSVIIFLRCEKSLMSVESRKLLGEPVIKISNVSAT